MGLQPIYKKIAFKKCIKLEKKGVIFLAPQLGALTHCILVHVLVFNNENDFTSCFEKHVFGEKHSVNIVLSKTLGLWVILGHIFGIYLWKCLFFFPCMDSPCKVWKSPSFLKKFSILEHFPPSFFALNLHVSRHFLSCYLICAYLANFMHINAW